MNLRSTVIRPGIIQIAIFGLFLTYCDEQPSEFAQPKPYVEFGYFFGECLGEHCIEIFKIEEGTVYQDTLNLYPSATSLPHPVSWTELSIDRSRTMERILMAIPDQLFFESTLVIGEPDAGDWGGLYLETNKTGVVRYWLIDKNKDNIPKYLDNFVDVLDAAIQQMQ